MKSLRGYEIPHFGFLLRISVPQAGQLQKACQLNFDRIYQLAMTYHHVYWLFQVLGELIPQELVQWLWMVLVHLPVLAQIRGPLRGGFLEQLGQLEDEILQLARQLLL